MNADLIARMHRAAELYGYAGNLIDYERNLFRAGDRVRAPLRLGYVMGKRIVGGLYVVLLDDDSVIELDSSYLKKVVANTSRKNKGKRCKNLPRFRKGQTVWIAVHGAGVTSYEEDTINSVRNGQVRVNDLSGPFDATSGKYLGDLAFGFLMELLSEKPKEARRNNEK